MVSQPEARARLPNDIALTERSRKFYDGTYKWDSDGFTDEHGGRGPLYRKFDCLDPQARAPTPLLPMFLDDNEEDSDLVDAPSLTEGSNSIETDLHNYRPAQDEHFLSFASDDAINQSLIIHRDDLFASHQHRDSLLSKCEHILAASKLAGTNLSLEECYKLCGVPFLEDQSTARSKMEVKPPETPRKNNVEQVRVPGSGNSSSTLSSVPSDLEEWDFGLEGKVEVDGNS
ncbi:hypothetical protein N0V94_002873 [Neodidymelliopsis sp. IMI 364377]|nr:hypothetical protein N0V94_002873 [Neodidymelliopsis sp. IMI 364377]